MSPRLRRGQAQNVFAITSRGIGRASADLPRSEVASLSCLTAKGIRFLVIAIFHLGRHARGSATGCAS